jgi:hypothetical protein
MDESNVRRILGLHFLPEVLSLDIVRASMTARMMVSTKSGNVTFDGTLALEICQLSVLEREKILRFRVRKGTEAKCKMIISLYSGITVFLGETDEEDSIRAWANRVNVLYRKPL